MDKEIQIKQAWYNKKWVTITLHTAVWILMFSLPFLLRPSYDNNKPHVQEQPHYDWLYMYCCMSLVWIGFFYANAYLFIPKYIYTKKYWLYLSSQLFYLSIYYVYVSIYLLWLCASLSDIMSQPLHIITVTYWTCCKLFLLELTRIIASRRESKR